MQKTECTNKVRANKSLPRTMKDDEELFADHSSNPTDSATDSADEYSDDPDESDVTDSSESDGETIGSDDSDDSDDEMVECPVIHFLKTGGYLDYDGAIDLTLSVLKASGYLTDTEKNWVDGREIILGRLEVLFAGWGPCVMGDDGHPERLTERDVAQFCLDIFASYHDGYPSGRSYW